METDVVDKIEKSSCNALVPSAETRMPNGGFKQIIRKLI